MRRPSIVLLIVLTACSTVGPGVNTPVAPSTSAPGLASTAGARYERVDAEPTLLTATQRSQDKALEPRAASIVDAMSNDPFDVLVATITKDNKRVLFGSDREGPPQVFLGRTDQKGAPPVAITKGPERVTWASFTRDEKAILFLRDQGADEFFAIYRVGLDGTGLTNLTPNGKLHRDAPLLLPRGKPELMVYMQHPVVDPSSELVVQSVAGGEPKIVYRDPLPAFAVDVTADGSRALVLHVVSQNDVSVLDIDLATGAARRIYPRDGIKEGVGAAGYSSDGKRVYVATDAGTERTLVRAVDVATGEVIGAYEETNPKTAIIQTMHASPTGDRVSALVDAGSHTEVRILDAKKLTLERTVKTPLGWINMGPFSDDGRTFSISIGVPERPYDIFSVEAATGALTPLREDARPALEALAPIDTSLVRIPAFDGLSIPTNVYLPKDAASKKLPTIVSVHGGPQWSSHIRYNSLNRFWLAQGFAVVEPNLRGSTGFGRAYEMADNREKRGDVLKDLERVNAWAKSQPWCDANRVVIAGGSYGGYITLLALTRQPKLWRAGVDLFGIADLRTFMKTTDQTIRAFFIDEFGDLEKDAALLDAWSPIHDADKIVAPLFVYAGQNDPRVPRTESDAIVKTMRARGVPVEYMVAPNEGHSLASHEVKIEFMTRSQRFLDSVMK